jgi:hypothetical protein
VAEVGDRGDAPVLMAALHRTVAAGEWCAAEVPARGLGRLGIHEAASELMAAWEGTVDSLAREAFLDGLRGCAPHEAEAVGEAPPRSDQGPFLTFSVPSPTRSAGKIAPHDPNERHRRRSRRSTCRGQVSVRAFSQVALLHYCFYVKPPGTSGCRRFGPCSAGLTSTPRSAVSGCSPGRSSVPTTCTPKASRSSVAVRTAWNSGMRIMNQRARSRG